MRQVYVALPRPQLIPKAFRHRRDDSQPPDRHGMQESDNGLPKQESSIVKEGGHLIIL